MYQSFSILSYDALYAEKKIIVRTNYDVAPSSVNEVNIKLYDKTAMNTLVLDFKVVDKDIHILIVDEIIPNVEYILSISGLTTALGDILSSGVRRKVIFESAVREVVEIIKPTKYQEITSLDVKLSIDGTNASLSPDKSYVIEIANDVAFINKAIISPFKTKENTATINTSALSSGQYYMRARVESDTISSNSFAGRWSETRSFILIDSSTPTEPVYIEDLKVISKFINGETPTKISIEFSGEIAPISKDNIIVIRRDV